MEIASFYHSCNFLGEVRGIYSARFKKKLFGVKTMNEIFRRSKKISVSQLPDIIIQGVLGLIYPPRCQMCGKSLNLFDNRVLCEMCYNNIKLNVPPFCKRCGSSGPYENYVCESCEGKTYYFDASYSACIYEGVIQGCIHKFKYRSGYAVERLFKDLLTGFVERNINNMHRYNLLVPVPLHRVKHRERTFNQSEILVSHLSKRFKVPMLKNNLLRTRLGKPQMRLSKGKRLKDIKGSFKIKNPSLFKDKSVLLVDDVFTTGATLNECSKILKEAGADSVEVLTLARGI